MGSDTEVTFYALAVCFFPTETKTGKWGAMFQSAPEPTQDRKKNDDRTEKYWYRAHFFGRRRLRSQRRRCTTRLSCCSCSVVDVVSVKGAGVGARRKKTKQTEEYGHGARYAASVTIRQSLRTSTGSRVKRREKAVKCENDKPNT